ncbi:MAG: PqqD family protein [Actinomycetia bacterium]|nr:PqqD family protein [Actinomycetes bacterium]
MNHRIGPPAAHIVEEELDDDIVLYDSERKQFYELNPTASDVWRLATGEFTEDEIVDLLASAYEVEPDELRTQVGEVLTMMTDAHLFADTE